MLQAVLFDLDGTLIDHDAARAAGLQAHLGGWLPGLEAQELARLEIERQRLEALHYDEYTRGECTFAEQRRRRVQEMWAALECEPANELTADAWFGSYLRHYRAAWRAFDDVLPALAALTEAHPTVVLGVVTNGEGEPQPAPGGGASADGSRRRQARPRCRRGSRGRAAWRLARSPRDRTLPRSRRQDLDAARATCGGGQTQPPLAVR